MVQATFLFLLGLAVGSFIGVISYRLPKGKSLGGRSYCDVCKKKISWYDNIPIVSFLRLGGRCRFCKSAIAYEYPALEIASGSLFAATGIIWQNCEAFSKAPFCQLTSLWGNVGLPFILFIISLFIAIFVIDLKSQIIPDELVFLGLAVTFVFSVVWLPAYYENLTSATLSASFLLLINVLTHGRGMGLGDVKLALLPGLILGIKMTIIWLFLAFLTGAVCSLILILLRKVGFREKIAFGPFLVIAFGLTLFFGNYFSQTIWP